MEDRYDVEVLVCHACAARDRTSYNRSQARTKDSPPPAGERLVVTPDYPPMEV